MAHPRVGGSAASRALTSDTYLAVTDDDCNHAGPTMGHGGGSSGGSEVRRVVPLCGKWERLSDFNHVLMM